MRIRGTQNRRWVTMTIAAAVVLGWIAGVVVPLAGGRSPVDLGLDLAGGVRVTYRPDFSVLAEEAADVDRAAVLARAKETLATRLSRGSTVVPDVVVRGDGRIVVSLPGTEDRAEALERIGRTYRLTFRRVLPHGAAEAPGARFEYGDRRLALGPVRFTGEMLDPSSIAARSASGELLVAPVVTFRFARPHDQAFGRFTAEHVGRELAILIDDEVFWVGRIESEIRGEGSLRGAADLAEADELARMLRSGSLPVPLEVERLTLVGSFLGHEVASEGLRALGLSLAALGTLLTIAYLGRSDLLVAGLLSTASLAVLVSGLTVAFGLTLDLAGIAGLVLSVGMGMDAFLIVFERLARRPRETRPGRVGSLLAGVYSFSGEGRTLVHANATTLLVVALLLRSERLSSFALFLIVGLLASILNILVTRRILAWSGRATRVAPAAREPLGWLRTARPGLFRARFVYGLAVLGVICVALGPGLVGDGPVGPGLGPEFRSGTQLEVSGPAEGLEAVVEALRGERPPSAVRHRTLGDPEEPRWLVTLGPPEGSGASAPDGAVAGALRLEQVVRENGLRLESLETIDPVLSASRLAESLGILGVSFLLLAVYFVAVEEPIDRFFRAERAGTLSSTTRLLVFGGVLLAVLVDLALVLAALDLLDLPITLPVVAALLAIVGYSVNDSVVLWSHVQEGWRRRRSDPQSRRPSPGEVVAGAVDGITSRAVLTTISTALPAGAILVAGPEALRDFAWAIIVGTVSGTLSSLFVVGSAAAVALRREERAAGGSRARVSPGLAS